MDMETVFDFLSHDNASKMVSSWVAEGLSSAVHAVIIWIDDEKSLGFGHDCC